MKVRGGIRRLSLLELHKIASAVKPALRRDRVGAHLVDLLVQHSLFETLEHSTELCPEEYGDDEDHHRDCDLPEQDIGFSVDGPHKIEVHTLDKHHQLDRRDRSGEGEKRRTK